MSADPMLRYIDRVLREQQMFELQREMHENMLRVEAIIDSAAPLHRCFDPHCDWCFGNYSVGTRVRWDLHGRHTDPMPVRLSPKGWENSLRNILPFRIEYKIDE